MVDMKNCGSIPTCSKYPFKALRLSPVISSSSSSSSLFHIFKNINITTETIKTTITIQLKYIRYIRKTSQMMSLSSNIKV